MDLPPEESLRWLVSHYAGLHARHGAAIGTPDLVQPTGDYFPDAFSATPEGVARLVSRVLEYAPVREGLDVRLRFVETAADAGGCACGKGGRGCGGGGAKGGSCGAKGGCADAGGGCGCGKGGCDDEPRDRVIEGDGAYLLELPVDAVSSPVALTTTLARSAGTIVLAEAGEEVTAAERGGMSELAAIASGLGVLLLSGAHIYKKSCGGPRVSRHTHLALEEAAVGLALFAALHGMKPSFVRAHLETTQREAFGDAMDWVESNPAIAMQLRARPEVLEAGMFRCETTKGFFGKMLARRAALQEEQAFLVAPSGKTAGGRAG
jgi:hypothetical protein